MVVTNQDVLLVGVVVMEVVIAAKYLLASSFFVFALIVFSSRVQALVT